MKNFYDKIMSAKNSPGDARTRGLAALMRLSHNKLMGSSIQFEPWFTWADAQQPVEERPQIPLLAAVNNSDLGHAPIVEIPQDFYDQVVSSFLKLPHIEDWPEVQNLFSKAASLRPKHWSLPLLICAALGVGPQRSMPAVLAIACAHLSIILLDDMLDLDPRGEYCRLGMPVTANMASALQSASLASLTQSQISRNSRLITFETINKMFLVTAFGQYLDVQSSEPDEETYWKIASTKSSPYFGGAFSLGALVSGVSIEIVNHLRQLGNLYGEMIQIHDDIHDVMEVPANPDWSEGKIFSLPIIFATQVDYPKQKRFIELRRIAQSDVKSLKAAQQILLDCGALSYCANELLDRYETSKKLISNVKFQNPDVVLNLFEDLARPVKELLASVDLDLEEE
jgi:geranylgeranyl pyrophosphate synthase